MLAYPQALVKQTNLRGVELPIEIIDKVFGYVQSDIEITMCPPMYGKSSFETYSYINHDIRIVAASLITEALGFSSSFRENYINDLKTESFSAPPFVTLNDHTTSLSIPTPFDSLIYSVPLCFMRGCERDQVDTISFLNFVAEIRKIKVASKNITEAKRTVLHNTKVRRMGVKLHRNNELRLDDGTTLKLQNSINPLFLHKKYVGTREFLMTSFYRGSEGGEIGPNLETILENLGTDSIYGPGTLKVMESIGYATKQNPRIVTLSLADIKSRTPADLEIRGIRRD